jgi:hypothetical protein
LLRGVKAKPRKTNRRERRRRWERRREESVKNRRDTSNVTAKLKHFINK